MTTQATHRPHSRDSRPPTVFIVHHDPETQGTVERLCRSRQLRHRAFESCEEFIEEVDRWGDIGGGVVVAHLYATGTCGLSLAKALSARRVILPVVLLAEHAEVPLAVWAIKDGVFDLLELPFSEEQLLRTLTQAMAQNQRDRDGMALLRALEERTQLLSPRERQVMAMVVQGMLNKQIAAELHLSSKTIEIHRAHVMSKMKAGSLAELVRDATMLERSEPMAASPADEEAVHLQQGSNGFVCAHLNDCPLGGCAAARLMAAAT